MSSSSSASSQLAPSILAPYLASMPVIVSAALAHMQQRDWQRAIACLDDMAAEACGNSSSDRTAQGWTLYLRGRCLWNNAIEDWQKAAQLGVVEAQTQLSVLVQSLEHEKSRPRLLSRLSQLRDKCSVVPPEIIDLFQELREIDQQSPAVLPSATVIEHLHEAVDVANALLRTAPIADDAAANQISTIDKKLAQAQQTQQLLQKAIREASSSSSNGTTMPLQRPPTNSFGQNAVYTRCVEMLNHELRHKRCEQGSLSRLVLRAQATERHIKLTLIPQIQRLRTQFLLYQENTSLGNTNPPSRNEAGRPPRKRSADDDHGGGGGLRFKKNKTD